MNRQKLTYWQRVREFANYWKAQFPDLGFISTINGYTLGLILGPFLALEEKRIFKLENNRDAQGLFLCIVNQNHFGQLWKKECQALARLETDAIPVLTDGLKLAPQIEYKLQLVGKPKQIATSPFVRYSAAYCLELLNNKDTLKNLEAAANDPDADVRTKIENVIKSIKTGS